MASTVWRSTSEMETLQTPEDHSGGSLSFLLCVIYMHPPQPETQLISQGNIWLCLNSLSAGNQEMTHLCDLWTDPGHLQHPLSHHSLNKHALPVVHQGRSRQRVGCKTDLEKLTVESAARRQQVDVLWLSGRGQPD